MIVESLIGFACEVEILNAISKDLSTQVEPWKSKLIKLWAVKQSLISGFQGCAAYPWLPISQYGLKWFIYVQARSGRVWEA